MNNHLNIGRLFNQSGCLYFDTLQRYQRKNLNSSERELVENHLKECQLCREALEGFARIPDQVRQQEHIDSLKKQLWEKIGQRKVKWAEVSSKRFNRKLVYISVAASIAIIMGLFGIFYSDFFPRPAMIADNVKEEAAYTEEETEDLAGIEELISEPAKKRDLRSEDVKVLQIEPEKDILLLEKIERTKDKIAEVNFQGEDTTGVLLEVAGVAYTKSVAETIDTKAIVQNQPEMLEKATAKGRDIIEKSKIEMVAVEYSPESRKKTKTLVYDSTPEESESELFNIVEEMPEFKKRGYKDFEEYIQKNLRYPEEVVEKEISGIVMVQFVIDVTGKIKNIEVAKKVNPLLDKEAVRVISSSPKWKPGKQQGVKVKVILTHPVEFKIK
ncbi:MAG: TonB family protein [Bacteroidetes bacterium]|nr:TonB family protein [Bacteroidota bacterium]